MIKINNTKIWGVEGSIRGIRNSWESWDKSDSIGENIGCKDRKLMKSLSDKGLGHDKFLRMIHVQTDILAPLYWWKQFDTYKIGVTASSTSTMHTITKKKFELSDFSIEHLYDDEVEFFKEMIYRLNLYVETFQKSDKEENNDWWQIIQLLPSSYNQLRTVDTNFAVLKNICYQRKNHKLNEWQYFSKWANDILQTINEEQNEL